MKRNILMILPLLLILTGCTFKETQKYRSGKDTFLSVGDGRFQISSFISEYSLYDEKSEYSLYDEKKEKTIFNNICYYYNDTDANILYLQNKKNKYIVVDYKNEKYNYYSKEKFPIYSQNYFDKRKIKLEKETFSNDNGTTIIYD